MPYIKDVDNRRKELREGAIAESAGELNYQIFKYTNDYHHPRKNYDKIKIMEFVLNFLGEKPNYQRYNDMVGALTCCDKELIRRYGINNPDILEIRDGFDGRIAIYEDIKIKENGDV